MITFIASVKDMLIVREKATIGYLEMMDRFIDQFKSIQSIVADYGSKDGFADVIKNYKSEYVFVPPNPDQEINVSKCYNACMPVARCNLIAPVNPDFRWGKELIEGVVLAFLRYDRVILNIKGERVNDKGQPIGQHTFSPHVLTSQDIINCGGWDERIWGWGKEDDDIKQRISFFFRIPSLTTESFSFKHIEHPKTLQEKYDKKNNNGDHMTENLKTYGKSVVNSYWRVKRGE